MARWSKLIEGSIFHTEQSDGKGAFITKYYESKTYLPTTKEEKEEFEDFSFIVSVMHLLVQIAKTDGMIDPAERKQIIDELVFQLEQRFFEYELLSKDFGSSDKEIINRIFTKISLENDEKRLDEILATIKKIYQYNPYKLKFIIRLCLKVAYADNVITASENKLLLDCAKVFEIATEEMNHIEKEVIKELKTRR